MAFSDDDPRFGFGANWMRFLKVVDDQRIEESTRALRAELGTLDGHRFLDVGSGSGLSSLAAVRLGAAVISFDVDERSVRCAEELRRRYAPAATWSIEHGSARDGQYLAQLGRFNVVYCWGVLHHTGDMWSALRNIMSTVSPRGRLWIAIYNDQGWRSKLWRAVKLGYNRIPGSLKVFYAFAVMVPRELATVARALIAGNLTRYVDTLRTYKRRRGMSYLHDALDWVGGYPFDVASPSDVVAFVVAGGFVLDRMRTTTGIGNNEFLFTRTSPE